MEIDTQSLNEFYNQIEKTIQDLLELRKYYVCECCGKFQKGKQRGNKYCSISCGQKAFRDKKLSLMTPQELKEFREKERNRISNYRSK